MPAPNQRNVTASGGAGRTMRLRARNLALLLVWLLPAAAPALDARTAVTQYRHQIWRVEDGLPSSVVFALAHTPDGFLWVGSNEGLARFDGVSFQRVPGLDAVVITLAVDREGVLVVATQRGDLYRYQGGRFQHLATFPDTIYEVAVGADDCIWVHVLDRGMSRVCGGKPEHLNGLPTEDVQDMLLDDDGVLWLATPKGLVRRATDGTLTTFTERDGLPADRVDGLVKIGREVWMVSPGHGLVALRDGKFVTVSDDGGLSADSFDMVRADHDGNVWFGGNTTGLSRVRGGRLAAPGPADRLPGLTVIAIFDDHEGNLWVSDRAVGLHRFSDVRFTMFGAPEGLPADAADSVTPDDDGSIWIGTLGRGLVHLKDGRPRVYGRAEGLPAGIVLGAHRARDGRLLVGIYAGDLQELSGERLVPARLPGGARVRDVNGFADGGDGTLWMSTRGHGLVHVMREGLEVWDVSRGLQSYRVVGVALTPDGAAWAATANGLARVQAGRAEPIGAAQGLTSILPTALHVDRRGRLWVGTRDAGLFRLDGERFRSLGGCGDAIAGMVEDDRGSLWMIGHRGVSRVSLEAAERALPACERFEVADGLRSPETQGEVQSTAVRATDGRLWFATARGAAVVDPADPGRPNREPPHVYIEELRADGETLARPEVPPGRRDLQIHYTAPNLTAPERVRFQYTLEGFDRGFVDAGTRRVAYYTNVPPGRYRFRVRACNDSGVWNLEGATADLVLLPWFWQTRLFQGLCALALALAGFGGYRLRVRRLEAQKRALAALVDERTSELKRTQAQLVQSEKMSALGLLTAGVAHELNNPVNFITSNVDALDERYRHLVALADQLERLLSDDDARRAAADRKRAVDFDFIREDGPDLIRSVRNGAERIAGIVERLRQFVRSGERGTRPADLAGGLSATIRLLEPSWGGRVQVSLDLAELPPVTCNAGEINQVFMNLLVNAAQAMGGAGSIEVTGVREGESVHLMVRDHGSGVPAELRERIFEPFFTTKPVGQGTGLGLSISFAIIRDHGGAMWVSGEAGQGATFHVRLLIAGPQRPVAPPPTPPT